MDTWFQPTLLPQNSKDTKLSRELKICDETEVTYMSITANFAGPVQTDATNRFRMLQSMARVYQTKAQGPIADSTRVDVTFDKADFDTDGMWSSGSNTRLTAPVAGKYEVATLITWPAGGSSSAIAVVGLYKSGNGSPPTSSIAVPYNSNNPFGVEHRDIFQLKAGEHVTVRIFQNTGSPVTLVPTPNVIGENNIGVVFTMRYVGE